MVSFMRYIFFFSLLILIGCDKNEFTLNFELSDNITDNFNVTYYATDTKGGITVQAVASVRNGKCLLGCITKKPTLIYITRRKNEVPLVVYGSKKEKIDISGYSDIPLEWNVGGNEINERISHWRENNIDILKNNEVDSVNSAVRNYVEENVEDPVSTILMLCYFDRSVNEKEYASLMASLKGQAKSPEWLTIAGRADQLYHTYYFPAAIQNIVMRAENNGKDTLSIDHKNPLFLFFWHTGDSDKKNITDSIKNLYKEFPDSALLLADICLDADSVAWRNSIRRDSLEKLKRFWVPSGLADQEIHKFKVDALPYFIVFDKEGHQFYRGTEISEAMKNYRDLYNRKDSL